MVRLACVLLSCSLLGMASAPTAAQKGGVLRNLVDAVAGVDRDAAFREGERQRAELERAQADAELARATADLARTEEENRRADERFQVKLAGHWEHMGLAPDEARSVAAAWRWTEQQDAITGSVRRNGLEAAARDIGAAYRSYNYLLANQLLVAYLSVYGESRAKPAAP